MAAVKVCGPCPPLSDADFWVITQQLWGGRVESATAMAQDWARGMQAENALRGSRRGRWLEDAQWRLHMSATGTFV